MLEACAGIPQASDTYVDPEGRFSMPLIGEWDQIETGAHFASLDVPEFEEYVNSFVMGYSTGIIHCDSPGWRDHLQQKLWNGRWPEGHDS